MAGEVRLEPSRAALLRGAVLHRLGDGAPVGAVPDPELGELAVLLGGPLLARDAGVEVAPPAAHALLVRPPLHAAGDVGPAKAVGVHQRLELFEVGVRGARWSAMEKPHEAAALIFSRGVCRETIE